MEEKKPIGQQPKWKKFVEALEKVVYAEHPVGYAIVYSDEMLINEVNSLLPEKDRISYRTFRRYKSGEIKDDEVLEAFVSSYKKALAMQAGNVMRNLAEEPAGVWQKWAWIMERKFDEWNERRKVVDDSPDASRLVFRVMKEEGEE